MPIRVARIELGEIREHACARPMPTPDFTSFDPGYGQSESLQVGKRHSPSMDMHAAELGTAVECRKHLARIEQATAVEGAFEPLLLREVGLAEHDRHEIALLHAHPMLTRQYASYLDAELEDLRPEPLGALKLARLVGIVEDERMQVAVSGVEHVGDCEPVLIGELAHAGEHLGEAGARDSAVHAVIIRRDASHRGKGGLAPGPEQRPFLL